MYIYKMVYTERENFTDEEYNALVRNSIIYETNYGTTEIVADVVQDNKNNKLIMNILNKRLGTMVVELLLNSSIDMVMVVND